MKSMSIPGISGNPLWQRWIKHLVGLILISVVSVSIAYQSRLPTKIDLARGNLLLTQGFFGPDKDAQHTFRWTGRDACIRFMNIGKATPILLYMRTNALRYQDQVYMTTITVNGTLVGSITRAGWRDWSFLITDTVSLRPEELVVGFHSAGFVLSELYPTSIDTRELGIAVHRVEIRPQWVPPNTLQDWLALLTIPSPGQLVFAMTLAVGLYWVSRILGASARLAFFSGCVIILLIAIQTAFFRLAQLEVVLLAVFVTGMVTAVRGWVGSRVGTQSQMPRRPSITALTYLKIGSVPRAIARVGVGMLLMWYVMLGIRTELNFLSVIPVPQGLLSDFNTSYLRAFQRAVAGDDPYDIRGHSPYRFIYPPPALFVIALFANIFPEELRVAMFLAVHLALLALILVGIARRYGYSLNHIWWWFPLAFAYAPLLELVHIGQINLISVFGIFLMFIYQGTAPAVAGVGMSLAILTKVTPGFFLLYLASGRSWHAISWSLVILTGALILTDLYFGWSIFSTYVDVFRNLLGEFVGTSLSLVSVLVSIGWIQQSAWQDAQYWLGLYLGVVFVISAVLSFRLGQREPLFLVLGMGSVVAAHQVHYHHYVFLLIPILVWMAWSRLRPAVVAWCFIGLTLIQVDRWYWTQNLLPHLFVHLSILAILGWQIARFLKKSELSPDSPHLH
ncbi:MAG: DUF2029 domain-containing protein [Chloroflexi bacterium]|nr:DUF2029 domain-containing protein [Chloroflexota bacterium]